MKFTQTLRLHLHTARDQCLECMNRTAHACFSQCRLGSPPQGEDEDGMCLEERRGDEPGLLRKEGRKGEAALLFQHT